VSGAVVAIAQAIRCPAAVALRWIAAVTLAAAQRFGAHAPRLALGFLDLGEACSRGARGMLKRER
jgi:hypothetical protein